MTRTKQAVVPGLLGGLLALLLTGCDFGGPKPLFTAEGRVYDPTGAAVAGAVVTDGTASELTDEAGRYRIALFRTELTVRKPGFAPATVEASRDRANAVRLSAAPSPARVALDTRWHAGAAKNLAAGAAAIGAPLAYPATPLALLDVLIMLAPGTLELEERRRLELWVRGGGRLIVCGEWGGYPGQDLEGLNALAAPAGITFTGATVKSVGAERPEWLTVGAVFPPSLGAALAGEPLHLFTSTSLALAAPARPIAQTDRAAYGVLAGTGAQVLAAVGPLGAGKVFALGDASLWLDVDSAGAGAPNLARGGNSKLLGALSRW